MPTRPRTRPSRLRQEPEALTWAREKAGLTKRALAGRIGISEQLVGEMESGWRSATPANLRRLATALNCPVVVLERTHQPIRLIDLADAVNGAVDLGRAVNVFRNPPPSKVKISGKLRGRGGRR